MLAGVAGRVYAPTAASVLRVGDDGGIVSTTAGRTVTRVAGSPATSDRLRRVTPAVTQPGFQIEVRFPDTSLTASQKATFTTAAARWQSIILGDEPDVTFDPFGTGDEVVDDLIIKATAPAIDGYGGILGQADYTFTRTADGLPCAGEMEFDVADVNWLEDAGLLDEVILHEMGHVLGLGSLWFEQNLLTGVGTADPRFTGPLAEAQYAAVFGLPAPTPVPVENGGGPGTINAHWREANDVADSFGPELMTGYINVGVALPISLVTVAQWADLGYRSVNLNGFDVFTPPYGGNAYPTVASLTPSAASVPVGNVLTLTANGVADGDGSVAAVRFYRETNNVPGLQVFVGNTGDVAADTLVGTDTTPGDGFIVGVPTGGVGVGTQTFYAQATDDRILIGVNATTTVAVVPVSVTGVVIDDGSAQRSRVRSITINVNGVATNVSGQSVTLTRVGGGAVPAVNISANSNGSTTAITLTFSGTGVVGGSLPDGDYQLSVNGALINVAAGGIDAANTGTAGSTRVVSFHRLFGDKSGDRSVLIGDFNAFALAFGLNSTSAGFDAAFDYDGDNQVLIGDFNQFALRFGVTI